MHASMDTCFSSALGLTHMQLGAKLVTFCVVSPAGNDENSSAELNVSAASSPIKATRTASPTSTNDIAGK